MVTLAHGKARYLLSLDNTSFSNLVLDDGYNSECWCSFGEKPNFSLWCDKHRHDSLCRTSQCDAGHNGKSKLSRPTWSFA